MLRLGGTVRRSLRLTCAVLLVVGASFGLASPAQAFTFPVDLGVTLTIDEPVVAGGVAQFHLSVTNYGPNEIGPTFYVDVSSDDMAFDADPPPAGCELQSGVMRCTGDGTLNVGASALWEGSLAIPASAPASDVTFYAYLTITDPDALDPNPDNNTSALDVHVQRWANLSVTQTDTPDPVAAGGIVDYTMTVYNAGPIDASGVVLSTAMPGHPLATVDVSQGSCSEGPYTGFICPLGTLAVFATATVTVHVHVPGEPGFFENQATVTSDEFDFSPSDNFADEFTDIVPGSADLSVTGEESTASVPAGHGMTYTFTLSNAGPDPAIDPLLRVDFDLPVIVEQADSPTGSCGYGAFLLCYMEAIQPGDSAVITLSAFPIAPGQLTSHAVVSESSDDPDSSNDETDLIASITPVPGVHYVDATDHGYEPAKVTVKLGETVQWNFPYDNETGHTATDPTQMQLFDSGMQSAIFLFQHQFTAAGRYRVSDVPTGFNGQVSVPLKLKPASGSVSTGFKLTWATGAPPAGFVYDVQIMRPGTSTWVYWKSDTTLSKASFIADAGPGTYQFRSRLRRVTGGASGWSGAKSIAVS
jgi:uncharacterized repeat protein (TIGR01451 family)